ncbi:MAG: hypothetical protein AB1405_12485 [Bdellovibrionota bacterium]
MGASGTQLDLGFSHFYHLDLSLFPFDPSSFADRLERAFSLMKAAGVRSFRPHIHWNEVEPVVINPSLKKEDVTDSMIEGYARGDQEGIFWQKTDLLVDSMVRHGIDPFLCLGSSMHPQAPLISQKRRVSRFSVAEVPFEIYLGHLYLYARAAVRRYKDRCRRWQLENEFNVNELYLLVQWKKGLAWLSRKKQDRIMECLHDAVKREDRQALTGHNFVAALKEVPRIYSWKQDIVRWNHLLDIIGIDFFPNYPVGKPIRIGGAMAETVKRVRSLGLNKPIYVLEDGYPVAPTGRGFSEKGQEEYFRQAIESSERLGIDGYFIYCFCSMEGAPGNEWHKQRLINDVEDWWGVVRADGSMRPAYDYLVRRAKTLS